jgi:hypothetical protein
MKNVVFWDMKSRSIPHRKHITSPLQSPAVKCHVRFEGFTAVTIKTTIKKREEWVVVRDTTGGRNRIYHRF